MPKISYIVPVYNAQDTLLRCVESLAYGTEQDIEIILVEDRSSDNSWELCLELHKKFPQLICIQNECNSGVSRTRNRGLEAAKGEYILFVDSDDWVTHEYATTLLEAAQTYPNDLVLCGFRFVDQTAGYRRDYVWRESNDTQVILGKTQFFPLMENVLLQSLWNKVFRREIIEQARLRFDESMSMGEDFEFVLAYMKAISCERCVMINKPLYSYIRANTTSLMSKFGLIENKDEYAHLRMLYELAGDETVGQYTQALEALRNNYIYHGMRSKAFTKKEKMDFVIRIVGEEQARRVYHSHQTILHKEQIAGCFGKVKALFPRIKGRCQREINGLKIRNVRAALQNDDFTLLSQNCISGVFYHDMGLPFQSPTINLYFEAADFVKFAKDPRRYLEMDLQMKWGLDYPLGILGDITVYFMHYETCEEAKNAWNRRKERVDYEKIVIVSTDRNGFDEEVFEQWKTIPYPKVLFTANPKYANESESVYYPHYAAESFVLDLIPKREFYKDDKLLTVVNSVK